MTSCHNAPTVDKTTTFPDSYGLRYNSGACCTKEAYSPPVIRQGKGEEKERTSVKGRERTLVSRLPCKAENLVEKEMSWRVLSWISPPYDM